MRIPTHGGFAALTLCAAAVVSASPAMAAEQPGRAEPDRMGSAAEPRVPVVVPLETLEASLPVDAPAVGGSLPVTLVKVPSAKDMAPGARPGGMPPQASVPPLRTSGMPSASVEAPLPAVPETGGSSTVRVETPQAPLDTVGPKATLGLPVGAPRPGAPRPGAPGVPQLKPPGAAVTSPTVQGQPAADVGVTQQGREPRLPVSRLVGTVHGLLPAGAKVPGGALQGVRPLGR
jgi:translation initiation factor IF-2